MSSKSFDMQNTEHFRFRSTKRKINQRLTSALVYENTCLQSLQTFLDYLQEWESCRLCFSLFLCHSAAAQTVGNGSNVNTNLSIHSHANYNFFIREDFQMTNNIVLYCHSTLLLDLLVMRQFIFCLLPNSFVPSNILVLST